MVVHVKKQEGATKATSSRTMSTPPFAVLTPVGHPEVQTEALQAGLNPAGSIDYASVSVPPSLATGDSLADRLDVLELLDADD